MGDIGGLFPDTDPRYKDIYSIELLGEVGAMLRKYGYRVVMWTARSSCRKPKIMTYREQMIRKHCESAFDLRRTYVNVKASTTGFSALWGAEREPPRRRHCILQKQDV